MNNISGLTNALPTSNSPASDSKSGGENSAALHDGRPDSFTTLLAGLSQPQEEAAAPSAKGAPTGALFKGFGGGLPDEPSPAVAGTPGNELTPAQSMHQSLRLATNLQLQIPSQSDSPDGKATAKGSGAASTPLVESAPLPATAHVSAGQTGGAIKTQTPAAKIADPASNAKLAATATPLSIPPDMEAAVDLAAEQPEAAADASGIGKKPAHTHSQSPASAPRHKDDGGSHSPPAAANAISATGLIVPAIAAPLANVPAAPGAQSPAQPSRSTILSSDAGLTHNISTRGQDAAEDAGDDKAAPLKVDIVTQATHFAPVASLSPAQQIVGATTMMLTGAAGTSQDAGAAAPVSSASSASLNSLLAAAQPAAPSIKTLDLQLEPPTLGAVSIKLNLSADGLAVDVRASQSATVDLLEKDKQSLTQGLSGAGYTVSGVAIGLAPANHAAMDSAGQGTQQGSSGQFLSGEAQANGGSQTQGGGAHDSSRQNQRQSAYEIQESPRPAAQRTAGSGLYI